MTDRDPLTGAQVAAVETFLRSLRFLTRNGGHDPWVSPERFAEQFREAVLAIEAEARATEPTTRHEPYIGTNEGDEDILACRCGHWDESMPIAWATHVVVIGEADHD